jgi:high frequency lysogenization protein
MNEYTHQDRAAALAGIYQAAQCVYELATKGQCDEHAFEVSLNTLFVENPQTTLDVFGGVESIQKGISTMLAQMSSDQAIQNRNVEITRYLLTLMILAKQLKNEPDSATINKIFSTLETAKAQQEQFGQWHENVIASIARAYSENISSMNPRIMVNGQGGFLQNPRVANKIRALLLSGLRAALLWYQVGGTRWDLLWSRKKYLRNAQAMYRPASKPNDDNTQSLFKQD